MSPDEAAVSAVHGVVYNSQNWLEEQHDENNKADDGMGLVQLRSNLLAPRCEYLWWYTYEIEIWYSDMHDHPETKTNSDNVNHETEYLDRYMRRH